MSLFFLPLKQGSGLKMHFYVLGMFFSQQLRCQMIRTDQSCISALMQELEIKLKVFFLRFQNYIIRKNDTHCLLFFFFIIIENYCRDSYTAGWPKNDEEPAGEPKEEVFLFIIHQE